MLGPGERANNTYISKQNLRKSIVRTMMVIRHDLCLEWLKSCQEAAQELQDRFKQARFHKTKCCHILDAALKAVMYLELAVHTSHLDVHKTQALPEVFAKALSNLGLALSIVQVRDLCVSTYYDGFSIFAVVQSMQHFPRSICKCLPWSQTATDFKVKKVIESLNHIAQRARELQVPDDSPQEEHHCQW